MKQNYAIQLNFYETVPQNRKLLMNHLDQLIDSVVDDDDDLYHEVENFTERINEIENAITEDYDIEMENETTQEQDMEIENETAIEKDNESEYGIEGTETEYFRSK